MAKGWGVQIDYAACSPAFNCFKQLLVGYRPHRRIQCKTSRSMIMIKLPKDQDHPIIAKRDSLKAWLLTRGVHVQAKIKIRRYIPLSKVKHRDAPVHEAPNATRVQNGCLNLPPNPTPLYFYSSDFPLPSKSNSLPPNGNPLSCAPFLILRIPPGKPPRLVAVSPSYCCPPPFAIAEGKRDSFPFLQFPVFAIGREDARWQSLLQAVQIPEICWFDRFEGSTMTVFDGAGTGVLEKVLGSFSQLEGNALGRAGYVANGMGAVTVATWKESVLKCDVLVLVEFWASWCGPCRMVHPIFEEIAEEYAGKIKCFKLNADDNEKITADYGIEKIPTVALFKNGEKRLAITGTMPKSVYVAAIEKVLASQEGNMAN
ncbi:hypothetical protein ACLOJK_033126 [Asimina triloba]